MNSEILAGLEYFERDKGIKREVLLEAINNACSKLPARQSGRRRTLRVELDPKSGEMKAYAKLTVVEKVATSTTRFRSRRRRCSRPMCSLATNSKCPVTPKDFRPHRGADGQAGDDAAHPPGGEGDDYDEFKDRAGEIVSGTVRRSSARM
jgi:N utilization substance protein A